MTHKKDGRDIYTWKSREPHDALDSTAQAFAVAASQGISGANVKRPARGVKRSFTRKVKPKVRLI